VTTLASKSACCSAGLIFSSSAAVTTFPGIDARSVAIAALRNEALGRVVLDDHARVLKLLVKRHRDLGRLKNKSACRLHALLMELEPGGMAREMTVTRAKEILDRIDQQHTCKGIASPSPVRPSLTSTTTRHR
jgi:hypothetical protein